MNILKQQFDEDGYTILKNRIDPPWVDTFKKILPAIVDEHLLIREKTRSDMVGKGFAFHLPLNGSIFLNFLQHLIDDGFTQFLREIFFGESCILNSFTALNNHPNQVSFATNPHRDVRFYTSDIPIMINALIMLDDFTPLNGPTHVLPGSHKIKEKPADAVFFEKAVPVLGQSGDVLLFNSSVWHSAGMNKTNKERMALALTFSIPALKQLLDYPRALGYDRKDLSEELKILLGYSARVPASLEEWYQPLETRLYKKM